MYRAKKDVCMNKVGIKIEHFLDQNQACVVIMQLLVLPDTCATATLASNKNKNPIATNNS